MGREVQSGPTAEARARSARTRRRRAEEKAAAELRERGWRVHPPEAEDTESAESA